MFTFQSARTTPRGDVALAGGGGLSLLRTRGEPRDAVAPFFSAESGLRYGLLSRWDVGAKVLPFGLMVDTKINFLRPGRFDLATGIGASTLLLPGEFGGHPSLGWGFGAEIQAPLFISYAPSDVVTFTIVPRLIKRYGAYQPILYVVGLNAGFTDGHRTITPEIVWFRDPERPDIFINELGIGIGVRK